MTKGLRIGLWILSSAAVLWTVLALFGLFTMGCAGCVGMMGDGRMGEGMMGGRMMGGMMLLMTLTWVVMLGLDALFVYLLVNARRGPVRARDRCS